MDSDQTNATPVQPAPAEPAQPSAPRPDNNKNRTTLIATVIGSVLAIGLIGWLIYSLVFAVSEEDYREASETTSEIISKGSRSTSDLTRVSRISSVGTETTINNNLDSAESSLEEFKKAHAELDGKKALRDSEVSEAYDKYSETYQNYVKFAEGYLASAKQVLPAVIGCEDDTRGMSLSNRDNAAQEFRDNLQPCLDELAKLENVKDADLKKFVDTYTNSVNRMVEIVDEAVALDSSDFRASSQLRSELNDIMRNLSDAQRDANSNIEKRFDKVHPREDANDLAEVLRDKTRK